MRGCGKGLFECWQCTGFSRDGGLGLCIWGCLSGMRGCITYEAWSSWAVFGYLGWALLLAGGCCRGWAAWSR
jgi:hypothetical protein